MWLSKWQTRIRAFFYFWAIWRLIYSVKMSRGILHFRPIRKLFTIPDFYSSYAALFFTIIASQNKIKQIICHNSLIYAENSWFVENFVVIDFETVNKSPDYTTAKCLYAGESHGDAAFKRIFFTVNILIIALLVSNRRDFAEVCTFANKIIVVN